MILEKESLDAVLRDWPAPGVNRSEAEADESAENPRADAILSKATSAARGDDAVLAALLEAPDRKSTRLNSSHPVSSRMPSSA